MAAKHHSVAFEPHVTLLSLIEGQIDELKAALSKISDRFGPFRYVAPGIALMFATRATTVVGSHLLLEPFVPLLCIAVGMKRRMTFSQLATGASFYQCCFVLGEEVPELMRLRKSVEEELSKCCELKLSNLKYMPHLSLLYADMTEREKEEALKFPASFTSLLDDSLFEVTSIDIYSTPLSDRSTKSWKCVAEIPLRGVPAFPAS